MSWRRQENIKGFPYTLNASTRSSESFWIIPAEQAAVIQITGTVSNHVGWIIRNCRKQLSTDKNAD
ncbi:MAG: hypothetical protein QM697_08370 [Lachnospiraceae bacterium]